MTGAARIPDKLYFKIGEVSKITKVKPYILRYWENEFSIISPKKNQGKQRVYSKRDVEIILYIKKLIQKEKLTLEGAKKKVKEFKKESSESKNQLAFPFDEKKFKSTLTNIRKEVLSIKKLLD
ncbi:MAG: MerR family transcriptional regulator [Deltaproteobacteria bacterium]|nr:MerR family transcriptional regulator [Deltaproteobacteria bacterium]